MGQPGRTIALLVFASYFSAAFAQDVLDAGNVEQKSYSLYVDHQWRELARYGDSAVRSGTDYYYLQMRIGIACYELKNYGRAEAHFLRALAFSTDDQLALEYLYYCYLFTGRYDHARLLSKRFGPELLAKTGMEKASAVDLVMLEGGSKKTDSAAYYDVHKGTYSNYFNPPVYFQLGIDHYVKRSMSFFHAFTYFSQESFTGRLQQVQYHLSASVPLKKNWLLTPALQAVNLRFVTEVPVRGGPRGKMQEIVIRSNNLIGSLAVRKTIKHITASLGTTVSYTSSSMQYLHSGLLQYALPGKGRITVGCTGYVHTTDQYSTLFASVSPFVSCQPLRGLTVRAAYLLNQGSNIIEDNGYLVNNSSDLTTSRWSFLPVFSVNRHLAVYAAYQLENKTEVVQGFHYRYHVFLGGIKIIP